MIAYFFFDPKFAEERHPDTVTLFPDQGDHPWLLFLSNFTIFVFAFTCHQNVASL